MTRRTRLLLWAALAALLAFYAAPGVRFGTDISSFLPDGPGSELAQISRALAHGDLARTMILCVGADETARAIAGASELADALRQHPEVARVRSGADPELGEEIYALYFPRRFYFLSEEPEQLLTPRLSDAGLRAEAEVLRRDLASPISPLLDRIAPEDPLGAFRALTERMRAGEPPLSTQDGVFTTREGRWAVLLVSTRHSAFDSHAQQPLLETIRSRFAAARARLGPDLVLELSGAHPFAVDAEVRMRADASLISSLSLVCVVALFAIFIRSALSSVIVLIPVLAGILLAATAGRFFFGRLDGLTLAFGAALIGAAIDYPIHVLSLWSLGGADESPWSVVRRLRGSLALAALTTLASFASLTLTSFPGFRELGSFAAVGIGGAFLTTLLLFPDLLPRRRRVSPLSASLAPRLAAGILALRRHVGWLLLVPAAGLVLAGWALPRLRWQDDLSELAPADPALVAEAQRVEARVSSFDGGRFVIALADGTEQAIERNDAVHDRLERLVRQGQLGGVRSLHALLWSTGLQQRNLDALRSSPELAARLDAAFADAGFRTGSFAPFSAALADPPPPLRLEELRASALGELATAFVFEVGDRTGVVTYLRGVRDPGMLRAALADLPDVHFFDQSSFLDQVYARFRQQTLWQIGIGSLLVLGLLVARYRDPRRAVAAFFPSVLGAVLVLSLLAVLRIDANLLHAVSLLMVMGMGVDYGVFIVDSVDRKTDLGGTLISLLLCCLTTIASFGSLALSSHPALRAIGLTTGTGIALALVLAPLALLVLRVDRSPAGRA